MVNLGSRVCEEVHIANLVSSIIEAEVIGESAERERKRLGANLRDYKVKYGTYPEEMYSSFNQIGINLEILS